MAELLYGAAGIEVKASVASTAGFAAKGWIDCTKPAWPALRDALTALGEGVRVYPERGQSAMIAVFPDQLETVLDLLRGELGQALSAAIEQAASLAAKRSAAGHKAAATRAARKAAEEAAATEAARERAQGILAEAEGRRHHLAALVEQGDAVRVARKLVHPGVAGLDGYHAIPGQPDVVVLMGEARAEQARQAAAAAVVTVQPAQSYDEICRQQLVAMGAKWHSESRTWMVRTDCAEQARRYVAEANIRIAVERVAQGQRREHDRQVVWQARIDRGWIHVQCGTGGWYGRSTNYIAGELLEVTGRTGEAGLVPEGTAPGQYVVAEVDRPVRVAEEESSAVGAHPSDEGGYLYGAWIALLVKDRNG